MHAQAIGLLLGPLYISESPATWGPRCWVVEITRLVGEEHKFLQGGLFGKDLKEVTNQTAPPPR